MVILSETKVGIDVKTVGMYCLIWSDALFCRCSTSSGNVDVLFLPCLMGVHAAF